MTYTIPDTIAPRLESLAKAAGYRDLSDYVTNAISSPASNGADLESLLVAIRELKQLPPKSPAPRSFFDSASESGFIGDGADYEPDLSSNPEYLQGFGE